MPQSGSAAKARPINGSTSAAPAEAAMTTAAELLPERRAAGDAPIIATARRTVTRSLSGGHRGASHSRPLPRCAPPSGALRRRCLDLQSREAVSRSPRRPLVELCHRPAPGVTVGQRSGWLVASVGGVLATFADYAFAKPYAI